MNRSESKVSRTCRHDIREEVVDRVRLGDDAALGRIGQSDDDKCVGRRFHKDLEVGVGGGGGIEAVFVGRGGQRRQLCD